MRGIDIFLSKGTDAVHIIDFKKRCFHFVSIHGLFLCGHPQEEAMRLGYDFYSVVVHPKDLRLLAEMHSAILSSFCDKDEQLDGVDYFSFNFRIRDYPQHGIKSEYVMVYLKLIPIFINGKIRFGICMLTLAETKKSGNLNVYYKNTPDFDEYSIESKKWKRQQIAQLTEQEISILKLAKQGMNNKKIADKLCLSYGRLRNIITEIYENLHVKSMSQAVIFATNHLMIFATRLGTPIPVKENACKKHQYHTLTPASLSEMQICLDNEQSINSIAKENGVSEGAIRYAIKHGKLIKDTN